MTALVAPFPIFLSAGVPLTGGSIYIGTANGNPETSPITVYWDAALTQPAAQPLKTSGGYVVRSGTPSLVYAATDYSITVRDKNGVQVLYAPTSADFASGFSLRADLASTSDVAKGPALVGYSASLSYATGTVGNHLAIVRSAKDYPYLAPTDGSSANSALAAYFAAASDGVNFLPAGTYTLTSLLDLSAVPLRRCVFKGVPGKTKITGAFGFRVILLGALNNVVFEDIIFENTYSSGAVNNTYAVVYTSNTDVKETHFRRCTFTSPSCDGNGLYFYPRTNPAGAETCVIDGLWITDCVFTQLGQVGLGINNNQISADKYTAAQRIYITGCKFDTMGINLRYGMGVTLNGYFSAFVLDKNYIKSPFGVGLENTLGINGVISNNTFYFDSAKKSRAISASDATATYPSTGMVVTGNKCLNSASYHSYASFCNDGYFAGNLWDFTGAVTGEEDAFQFIDSNRNTIDGDRYVSDKKYALRFTSPTSTCSGNRVQNAQFSTGASAANTAVVNFDGASTTLNQVTGRFTKGTGGSLWTQTNSALNNVTGDDTYPNSGTYTPTLTNTTNIAASTAYVCYWTRVNNVVTVTGRVDVDPTAAGATATLLGISLPIASNLTASEQLAGTGSPNNGSADNAAALFADFTNDRASMSWQCNDLANHGMWVQFSYPVL